MPTFIRLTYYNSSEEKEKGFFEPKNRYVAKQEDFEKIPGNPIAYWISNRIKKIFEKSEKLKNLSVLKSGKSTNGKNEEFFRYWFECNFNNIFFHATKYGENYIENFIPLNKGGSFRKWYGNNEYVTNKKFAYNDSFLFKKGLTWSDVTSGKFSARLKQHGIVSNNVGKMLYVIKETQENSILGLLNTNIINELLKIIIPTMHFDVGYVSELPVIFPKEESEKQIIDKLTQECIDISKEDWDSRETSWDFRTNELVRIMNYEFLMLNESKKNNSKSKIQNLTLETIYNRYCDYWKEKFFKLHSNEEELNRLFIEIYELQDELTPDVPLEDITILKQETKIVDGKLIFNTDEIVKQFISYAVGCMFGRYSLDHEGLHIADIEVSIEEANSKFNIQHSTFTIDDDNIIPAFEFDFFEDDIFKRFKEFLKITFSEETLYENLSFIANALGKKSNESDEDVIRRYFHKEFYSDHVSRYNKRPIYWMFSSNPKGAGAFNVLIYMHRYYPGIVAKIRTDYLHPYMEKLESEKNRLQQSIDNNVLSGQTLKKAQNTIDKIEKYLIELREYDVRLKHYADKMIKIDLDDGVKVNYCKFQDILVVFDNKLCK
ncbi:BREX-1 system adenine-specific DNA-methyltransferase PglX [Deferribacterales bacterium Es71-Z0220]|uniref:BREX-1 system adenine-specific DNA-methyltransferase PglX n=1 Tax=Deferrivibrio essentukiensis TaxID=2880922 RepID=UPI001F62458F|nr:BREX-1 system adenine-specific DNA-methyltransferase PglX [Deferrivibrio essentukiensis]MCB4205258.1 BREX-1 system adenine-specific DNA-methyltransferase PglX [Deferrivibrio essentukiensis]